ncbi:MAG: biotin--[acetyl-CoA-carboxylase] ligase [Flavobacteriaceae bacterium]|nr:biotin--[acetyl-CoA-carboxylase] ligase [Flavobacteriaceae bacterium]
MNIIKLNAIGSTNDYLKALSKKTHLADGTVVLTQDQTKGRGQMGSQWVYEVGKSLAFSVFKRFVNGIRIDHQFWITAAVSLQVIKCLEQFGIPQLSVKWPNDIMTGDKKLCGILVENQVQGSLVKGTVVGIGLNVNNDTFENLPKATSMKIASGTHFDIDEVFETLAAQILLGLHQFASEANQVNELYEEHLYRKDQISVFSAQGKLFNGMIIGVSKEGQLLVETEDEKLEKFRLKEIRLLN